MSLAPCGRCKEPAPFGFGPPHGREDRGTLHACMDHRDAAEAAWRRRYGLGEHPPAAGATGAGHRDPAAG